MKSLRNRFERFCLKHRNWGIPNLMLYIVLGSAVVYLMSYIDDGFLYGMLYFDKELILQGQVWRLITYIFIDNGSDPFLTLLILYCYYSLGRSLENSWGTFRFNLFYFGGVILMDIFAMICSDVVADYFVYYNMIYYLHLSLLLAYATTYPDTQFTILLVIPVTARILSIIYLTIVLWEIALWSYPVFLFPHNLFPLVALANYFLFMGKDVLNLLPISWRSQGKKKTNKSAQPGKTIPFRKEKADYNHRCAVCGRTDVTNPELEFRYCSRCNGYHCYCQDHISNHQHVE